MYKLFNLEQFYVEHLLIVIHFDPFVAIRLIPVSCNKMFIFKTFPKKVLLYYPTASYKYARAFFKHLIK